MSEETFVRELERHADRVHGAPLSFVDVRGRARSIRRRRRAAAAAAVAAAVAVVAIVPTVLSGGLDRADRPQPAPPAPGHTAVLHDGVVTMPDGSTVGVDVDNADVTDFGVLSDGRIVVALQRPYAVRVYAADGSLQKQFGVQMNAVTMSPRHDVAAWVGKDYRVRVLESGAAEPATMGGIPMPGEAAGSIDAVLDAQHLLVGDGTSTSGELTPDGVADLGTSEELRVTDVSPDGDLWAVSFPPDTDQMFGCAGLYDPAADEVVARSCEVGTLEFAPDGKHLVSAFYENNMAGNVSVVDRELDEVRSIDPAGRGSAVSRVGWADANHLLVGMTSWKTSDWSLQRLPLVGDPVVVDGPTGGRNPEMTVEYVLSQ